MATLTLAERAAITSRLMQQLSEDREQIGTMSKGEIRGAIDAADQWISDNSASYNTALPVAVRTVLTPSQKARLLAAVILRRFESGV